VKGRGLSAAALLQARQVLLEGGAIALAAEGELTWDGRLQHPLAPGTAWLALRTAAWVVPVISCGGYDLQPRWRMEKIRLTGRVTIRAGSPFKLTDTPLTAVNEDALAEASQRIWDAMHGPPIFAENGGGVRGGLVS
jgi:1-acyl-sn-glycerol-3-phosphate acyltransferase